MHQSDELRNAYIQIFKGIEEGRLKSVNDILSSSDAVSGIGTDPAEWWMGRENLTPIVDAQFAALHQQGATIDTSNAEAWVDGDVGFVMDQPTIALKDGRSVQLRATTIFHREGGTWKMVHQHASIGVPNDQVEAFSGVEEAVAQA